MRVNEEVLRTWRRMELWTLREAAYLLCARAPEDEAAFKIEMHTHSDVAQAYRKLKDATLLGTLRFIEVDGLLMRRRVRPIDVERTAHAVHTTRGRRSNILDDVIATAVQRAGADAAPAKVWTELESMARGGDRPAPLAGVRSGGVLYHDGGSVREFTRAALRARLLRAAKRGNAR